MTISFKAKTRLYCIYGLADPISGNIRYIGQSYDPKIRYKFHLKIKKPRTYKEFWIVSLKKLGLLPELVIIETTTFDKINERERFWIAEYRSLGFNLTNLTDGGEGCKGRKHSEETKALMSFQRMGNKYSLGFIHSQETRKKMSERHSGMTGKKHSEESRSKMSQKLSNRMLSEEHKSNISEGLTRAFGLKTSEERSQMALKSWESRRANKEMLLANKEVL